MTVSKQAAKLRSKRVKVYHKPPAIHKGWKARKDFVIFASILAVLVVAKHYFRVEFPVPPGYDAIEQSALLVELFGLVTGEG